MLFSQDTVANFLNNRFETAWESVRPVPLVTIDFGAGTTLTRTLHGNIATYLCTADGQVLDILGGIYTPDKYVANLNQFLLLARYADRKGKDKRAETLKAYHELQEKSLAENGEAKVLGNVPLDMSKSARIERSTIMVVFPNPNTGKQEQAKQSRVVEDMPKLNSPEDLANWKVLIEDTQANETIRRKEIHALLKDSGLVTPDKIKKPLYKDILHADLDDPYLGLGKELFANYPFAKEDRKN